MLEHSDIQACGVLCLYLEVPGDVFPGKPWRCDTPTNADVVLRCHQHHSLTSIS